MNQNFWMVLYITFFVKMFTPYTYYTVDIVIFLCVTCYLFYMILLDHKKNSNLPIFFQVTSLRYVSDLGLHTKVTQITLCFYTAIKNVVLCHIRVRNSNWLTSGWKCECIIKKHRAFIIHALMLKSDWPECLPYFHITEQAVWL